MLLSVRSPRAAWHAVQATAVMPRLLVLRHVAISSSSSSSSSSSEGVNDGAEKRQQPQHAQGEKGEKGRGNVEYGLGRMQKAQDFFRTVETHILKSNAKPLPVVIDRALKNLAAPDLLNIRPRIKAMVGHKIFAKALNMDADLPVTSYDFYLRLQCSMPDAQHRVPVHAVHHHLKQKNMTPDDVLLFTMMRAYALCGDIPNARTCFDSCANITDETYAQLALAHATNGDAAGILDVITEAGENRAVKSQATLLAAAVGELAHVGTTRDVETVLASLDGAGVKLRLSMLDNYLRALAAKGDADGVEKLYEWKLAAFEGISEVTRLEKSLLASAVFGEVQDVASILARIKSSGAVQFKPLVNVIDILALRGDGGRLEQLVDMLLAEESMFKSHVRVQDAIATALIRINDFDLAERTLVKIRRVLPTLYGFYHAAFECLAHDPSVVPDSKKQRLVALVEWGTAAGFADSREFMTDVFKATAELPKTTKKSIQPLWQQLQNGRLLDVSVWNANVRSARSAASDEANTIKAMETRGIADLQTTYVARIKNRLDTDNVAAAKQLAIDAVENTKSTTRTVTIFAPILRYILATEGAGAGLNYLSDILQVAARMDLCMNDSLLAAWCDGCTTDEALMDAAHLLRDVTLLPGTLSKMLHVLACAGNVAGVFEVANGMGPGQFTSAAVDAILSTAILEGGVVNEDTLHSIAQLHAAKYFTIQESNWARLLSSCPNRQQVVDQCKAVFPSEAERLDAFMLAEPLRAAKVDDIVTILLDMQLDEQAKAQLARETLERVASEHPASAVRLAEELAVDKILSHADALTIVASHFFAPEFIESNQEHVRALVARIVQAGVETAIPSPPNHLFQSVLPSSSPRDAARILKLACATPKSASKTQAMVDGLAKLIKGNAEARETLGAELQNLSVNIPFALASRTVDKLPLATNALFAFLPLSLKSRHMGNRAARSSIDAAADYLKENPKELPNVLLSFAHSRHKGKASIVAPAKKLLEKADVAVTRETMEELLPRLSSNRRSDQHVALALLQYAGSTLDEDHRAALEDLSQQLSMRAGDNDAVAKFLQKNEAEGATMSLADFAQLFRARFQDADFLLSMLKRAPEVCPGPWTDKQHVEQIIFALIYHRQNKQCMQEVERLLEQHMPLTDSLKESQLQLYINMYTRTNRVDAAMTVFQRLERPDERNFIDMIRALRDAERMQESVEFLEKYLRECKGAEKQHMMLKEMSTHLDRDSFDTVFQACISAELVPPPRFIQRHFQALFTDNATSAAARLEEYLGTITEDSERTRIVDMYIDAALSTKHLAQAIECVQHHPTLTRESHILDCSRRAVQFRQHRAVETLARLVAAESYSQEAKEAVMLDRMRVYSRLGQLDDVVDTLWADVFATMKPSVEFLRAAYVIWEDNADADLNRMQLILQQHLGTEMPQS
ncbi:hypothetical protein PTSG_09557 [Salpingoeca rosetta]|uniref:Leucine-rich PPR motif-containing protein, mitochondrial n=1 Tax=Salpingoeca rosetta (strain ATCC 50818 / BSB-021) TaxID=946362 RepID=F2ULC2_SALR5|nr:uncharacterized protein PTSG_09557 [Salpingoeca rosetta]EGD77921.1 hypothetical protein PTSG_09557 [Salpingoeca rosetta]|eukprot:XP_004989985.1 hypothetical protein PTSG_09557 [Salpingoeca rosetta]